MKRPLFPPMMTMLTCPGHGNMGRGQAGIPLTSMDQSGLPSILSTLAEDAVKVGFSVVDAGACCTIYDAG